MFHSDDPTNHVVEHNCDSTHGQSGSPMWTADNNVSNLTYDKMRCTW
jgi:V8-like Glu-specific endopeptidase